MDVTTGDLDTLYSGASSPLAVAGIAPSGMTAASGDDAGILYLWHLPGAASATPRMLNGHNGRISAVAFSPDGRTVVTGGEDRTARVWDVTSGRSSRVLPGHPGTVDAVAFSPDGRTLATAAGGRPDDRERAGTGGFFVWDVATGRRLRTLATGTVPVVSVSYARDGRLASCDSSGRVRIWRPD